MLMLFQLLILALLDCGQVLAVKHPLEIQLVGQSIELFAGQIRHTCVLLSAGEAPVTGP